MQKMRDKKSRNKCRTSWKKEKETGEWIKKIDTELAVTVH